ncbi:MAG TPA: tRNA pseudouridine(55) synthase TruB [Candidatus Binataceae bacterium]|nr:tRNA pseudouridine(55) synthase TruB [Candidatus Binataceae bacterium]
MNGIVLIDKPAGITSAEVVRRVKRFAKPARVGHLGTLDPFATGLLPILIGEATKLAPFLEGGDKRYAGLIKVGTETNTLDRDGSVVRTAPVPPLTQACLAKVAARFTGKIVQTPPVFSAIKRAGVPLYKLARKGVEVEPPEPREIEVGFLKLEAEGADSIRFEVVCSTGTYIRSLARDIGVALESAAYLDQLGRLRSGGFSIEDASALDAVLTALESDDQRALRIIALSDAIPDMPGAVIDSELERRLRNGDSTALDMQAPSSAGFFKVLNPEAQLIAVARAISRVTAVIERIFNQE